MRSTVLCLVLVSFAATMGAAQWHADGWFVPGYRHLHYADASGKVTSVAFSSSYVYAGLMNLDNRTALVFDYTINSILKVDPKTLVVVGTLLTDSSLTSSNSVADMAFDSNGDLYVACYSGRKGIFKTGIASPALTPVMTTGPFANGAGNMSLDPDNGELIVTPNFTAATVCYSVRRDGTTVTTLGTNFYTRYGTYRHILTGDIYSGSCCGKNGGGSGAAIIYLKAGTSTATTLFNNSTIRGGYSPRPDRASAATQRIVLSTWRDTGSAGADGLWQIDIASTTMSKLATMSTGNTHKAVPVFGRNVQTARSGRGTWDALVSFPSLPGANFLLAVSLSGTRPFVRLPDGRAIPIIPDLATQLSVNGQLAPFVSGNVGQLNPKGEALAKIDLRLLGPGANGLVFFLLPVVLDARAPFGLSVIGDPRPLVVEGL